MSMENIKSKIAKLIALSQDEGASEQEAELATQRALELLSKYNLSMSDVRTNDEFQDIEQTKIMEVLRDEWIKSLYSANCKLYFCKYYYTNKLDAKYKTATEHNIVGRPHNQLVAREMTQYLIKTVKKLSEEHTLPIPGDKRTINKIRRNFELGCAHRIVSRIHTLAAQKMADDGSDKLENKSSGNNLPALYKSELALCEDFLQKAGIRLSSGRSRSNVTSNEAYRRGQSAGNSVSLNTQIKGAASRHLLN